ncbi:hypothetical protein [Luteococcus sp. OSA5]|uniref:hypothetical protein n=1 Tax=Luteococcus sp. OSA5 TaxID=3401630 RepID=UPI003B43644E
MSHSVVTETFHNPGGIKTGAIVRRIEPTSLSTLVCFTEPGGLHHVECRIEFDGENPFDWTHYVMHNDDEFVERDHEQSDPGDVVPSFAEPRLVQQLLHSGEPELSFTLLDEGSGQMRPARLVHKGDEVGLYSEDHLLNRHRVVGDEVIASDWNGAGSRVVHEVDELLDGLDEQVALRVRNFLKS